MIKISDYGVELVQLTFNKIELVRKWRNSDKIKQYMEFRGEITKEMQINWFEKVNQSNNDYYFLIKVDGKEVGLINIKSINRNEKCAESGIFIWDDTCLHSGVSYRAALCLFDFSFQVLSLDYLNAHIYNTNIRSIKFHEKFGFELKLERQVENEEHNDLYILRKELYIENRSKVIDYIKNRYNTIII